MKTTAAEQAAIDEFIAKKGVTHCPTASVAPVAGGAKASQEILDHNAEQAARAHPDWKHQRDISKQKSEARPKPVEVGDEQLRRRRPTREIGPAPELLWLPLSKLKVDPVYQRQLDAKHVKRLAEGFVWAAFKPLTVTPGILRSGDAIWWIIDGQHEAEAARIVGIVDVPCLIVTAEDQCRAASAFVAMNKNRKAITGPDLYYAALVAKEPWALQIEQILAAVGVAMIRQGIPKKCETKSVATLRAQTARLGPVAMKRALLIIKEAWPDERNTFRERSILSIARLVGAHPGTSDAAVTRYAATTNSYRFERAVWDAAAHWASEPAEALGRLVKGERPTLE